MDRLRHRRRWTAAEKATIVAESFAPGASVSGVARRHGLNPNQISTWRRAVTARCDGGTGAETSSGFMPVLVTQATPSAALCPAAPIEVIVGRVTVRLDAAVDVRVLERVLEVAGRVA